MDNFDYVVDKVLKVINSNIKKKTTPYDATGTVTRIDGNTAWVHFENGVDETPVVKSIDCNKGDKVRIRISGGAAYLSGNETAPPTDDRTALAAKGVADSATILADNAHTAAESAIEYANEAKSAAKDARGYANEARESADEARGQAREARISAENANEYAIRAYANLGAVESVVETLEWITAHGTMTSTQDLDPPETSLNPSHVYFVEDDNGEYEVGNDRYSLVKEPKSDDIADYYLLTINESLNNYVAIHLALTDDGLKIVNTDNSDYHMLITPSAVQIKDKTGGVIATYSDSITLGVGNVVTTVTNQAMTCENIYFRYLYPTGTSLVLEARANGHFSIKPI